MKLIWRFFLRIARLTKEVRGIRGELKRIADYLEVGIAPILRESSSFRAFGEDAVPGADGDPDILYSSDEDYADVEDKEDAEEKRGGPAIDGFYGGDDGVKVHSKQPRGTASFAGPESQAQVSRETGGES